MRIKLLQTVTLKGHEKAVKAGWEGEHDDEEAKALINVGYAKEIKEAKKASEPPENKNKGAAPENKTQGR